MAKIRGRGIIYLTMSMPIEKAKKILGTYSKNNYNARKTLEEVGYSPATASKSSKPAINSAYKALARSIIDSPEPAKTAQSFVGLSDEIIRDEYVRIIMQNKDLTNKLKALLPLLKEKGIVWQDDTTVAKPTVNLTMIKNEAQQSHGIEMGGGSDARSGVVLSSAPLPKNSQNTSFPEESEVENDTEKVSIGGKRTFSENMAQNIEIDKKED